MPSPKVCAGTSASWALAASLPMMLLVACPPAGAQADRRLRPLDRCHAYLSVGDARFALGWQPVDSPATIDAMFDWVANTYHARRMYWREERAWRRHFKVGEGSPAQGPLIYDYSTRWAPYLDDKVRVNEAAVAAARRNGMGIYLFTGLFDHGVQPDVGVLAPYLFEDRLRIAHPEWCSLDRWGQRRQPGPIDFCYPEARQALGRSSVSSGARKQMPEHAGRRRGVDREVSANVADSPTAAVGRQTHRLVSGRDGLCPRHRR